VIRRTRAPLALAVALVGCAAAYAAPFVVADGLRPLDGSAGCRELAWVADALWTTRRIPSRGPEGAKLELLRLDPSPGAGVVTFPLDDRSHERDAPPVLAARGDRIWTLLPGDPVELVAFDARARKLERRVRLEGRSFQRGLDLAIDDRQAWALAGAEILRVDAATGVLEAVDLATIASGVALAGGSLWLRTVTGGEIQRFDAATLARLPRLALPSAHHLASRLFARAWTTGGSDPAVLLSSRPQNLWTGRPAPDVVAALDAASGTLVPALRLERGIVDVEVSGSRAAVVALSSSSSRSDLSLLLLDWPRRAIERELPLGTQLDSKFPSSDPDYRPSSIALGADAAWVCLADYGVVGVPFDPSR
jgi:hypothetical protein